VQSITAIDLHWAGHPRSIACALLRFQNYCALIDPGPASTLDTLRQRLEHQGVTIGDLSAVLLTHIHLDHAAVTGALVRENPRIHVYVHSRGVDHLIDPTKLLQSASRLYGDDLERLFGVFLPVPSGNIHALEGGEVIAIGGHSLQVLYTPGHATHHVTYFDPAERVAFVGDTCGISIEGDPYILPATPPPDISVELWDTSLDTIAGLHPKRLFLTHFSFSDNPAVHIANYRERLHQWRDLTGALLAQNLEESAAMHRFAQQIAAEATQFLAPDQVAEYLFNGALNLSWLGLARYHRKRAEQLAAQPTGS
jgi:glyoxylase-like metal-dependent hydrolase (beta-lactamase superfamily II)